MLLRRKTTLLLALLAVGVLRVKVGAAENDDDDDDLLRFGIEGSNDGELLEDNFDTEGSSSGGRGLESVDDDGVDDDDSEDDDSSLEDLSFEIEEDVGFRSPQVTVSPSPVPETTTEKGLEIEEPGVGEEGEVVKGSEPCSTGECDKDIVGAASSIKIATEEPDVETNCRKAIEDSLKGEYGTCDRALDDIQSVSLLLHRVSEQGIVGPQGLKGSKGEMGEKGMPGSVVFKGQKGSQGDSITGARGPMGPPGAPGYPGSKGDRGPVGPSGLHGLPGESVVGPAGPKGEKGECIETKVEGPPGPQGRAGLNIQEFNNLAEMFKMEKFTTPGSLAYVWKTGKFYGRTSTGWASLLMHQVRNNPVSRPHMDRTQSRRAKLSSVRQKAKQRQKQSQSASSPSGDGGDGGDDGDENEIYNDPPMTPTTTEASTIKLNRTLFRIPTRLRLISLNSPWSGNMHGIDHINYECQKEAMIVNLKGIFRAFLSTTGVNITSLIHNRNDTIVNLYNNTLYESKRQLFRTGKKFLENKLDSLVQNGRSSLYSFDGDHVILDPKWEFNMLWHGAHIGGRHSRRNCQNWTTNDTESLGIASDFLFRYILDQKFESCSSKLIVLCIELSPVVLQDYLERRPAEYLEPVGETKESAGVGESSSSSSLTPSPANFFVGEEEYKQFLMQYYAR